MQSNRVAKLENLDELGNLEEIYLGHNGISKIEGLEKNVSPLACISSDSDTHSFTIKSKLRVFDIGNNQISCIENLSHLEGLEEFWVSPPAMASSLREGEANALTPS